MSGRKQENQSHISALAVVRRFGPYMRRRWALIGGSSCAMFFEVVLRLLEPWPLKFIFDAASHTQGAPSTGIGVLDSMSPTGMLTTSTVVMVLIIGMRAGATYIRRVGFALAGNVVLTEVRGDLFSHLQRLSLGFHNKKRSGDLATRLTGDIGRLQEVVSTAVLPLAAHALTVVGVVIVMFAIEWRLALVAVAVLPIFWFATQRLGREIRSTARRERARHGEMGAIATEAIGSIRVVQSLGGESTHHKRFAGRNLSSLKEGVHGKRLAARLLGTADVFIAAGTAIMLWVGAWLVMRGDLQLTALLVFFFYHKNMTRPIRNIAKYSGRTARALASAERVVELLDTAPSIRESPRAVEAPVRVETIAFENVSFGYEQGTHAIVGASFESSRGMITAIVGCSGSGKSTLMSLLLRLYDADTGRITADGQALHEFKIESWRRRVAVVPQETTLFAASVRENIAFGQPGLTDMQIEAAARIAGAGEFIQRLPEGYDTVIGERGSTLSEGQKQRLAIARAAVRETPILVVDEPTASLDTGNTNLICRAIDDLARDRVCLVISHDLRTTANADQIVCLDHGQIAEIGTHSDLLTRDGVYARLHKQQRGIHLEPEVADAS